MRTRGFLVVGALVLAAAAFVGWWRLVQSRRAAAATTVELQAKGRALAADLKRETDRALAAERLIAAGGATGAKAAPSPANPAPRPPTSQMEIVASSPKLQVLELKRLRAAYRSDYRDLFQAEGLTAAQIERFVDNLVKEAERIMDLRAVANSQDEGGKQTAAALEKKVREDYEAAQRELLGAERYARMNDLYLRTVPIRNIMIAGLAGAAALEGVPLTGEQGDRLIQAALASPRADSGNAKDPVSRIDWEAMDARAREILTPAQYEIFTKAAPYSGFTNRFAMKARELTDRAYAADVAAKIITPGARK